MSEEITTIDIVRQKLNFHGYTQKDIGIKLGLEEHKAARAITQALGGQSKKLVDRIIKYFIDNYDYDIKDFQPKFVEDYSDLNNELEEIREDVKEIKSLLIKLLETRESGE